MADLIVFTVARAEHELRVREAQRFWQAEAASRLDQGRTARTSLRRRAGNALIVLGARLQGTTASPAAGELGQVAS